MKFVDANVLLRAITADDPGKAEASAALFRRAETGDEELTTCEAVITEVVYVLSSRGIYGLSHADVQSRLVPLLRLRGFRLPGRQVYLRALELYVDHRSLDFEDVLVVAHMEQAGIGELLSYDRDFDRIVGLRRSEPEL